MIQWWQLCAGEELCPLEEHLRGDDGLLRHVVPASSPAHGVGRITCPDCGRRSPNPHDIAQGYCTGCHWWTSDELLGPQRRQERAAHAAAAGRHFDFVAGASLLAEGVRTPEYVAALRAETVAAVLASPAMLADALAWDKARGGNTVG